MVSDVVHETLAGGLTEIRMSDRVLEATLELRSFLFESVYENDVATAEFGKAEGILGGLWEKVRQRPDGLPGPPDGRGRGPGRGRPGLRGRHDRPLCRQPVRAALHPQALGGDSLRA